MTMGNHSKSFPLLVTSKGSKKATRELFVFSCISNIPSGSQICQIFQASKRLVFFPGKSARENGEPFFSAHKKGEFGISPKLPKGKFSPILIASQNVKERKQFYQHTQVIVRTYSAQRLAKKLSPFSKLYSSIRAVASSSEFATK